MTEKIDISKKIASIKDPVALEVISFLLEEIKFLKEEISNLKKDSSTSSKPPSSDITKPRGERRKKGKRKIGGQKGSKRNFKNKFSKEEVDEVCELELNCCTDCNSEDLESLSDSEVKIDQNAELPENPIKVTEYRRHGKYCDCCNKVVYAELPEGVVEGQLFGPRLQSLIAYMKGNLGSSYSEIEQYCVEVLGIKISQGMLAKIVS